MGEVDQVAAQTALDVDAVVFFRHHAAQGLPHHDVQVITAVADLAAAGVGNPGLAVARQLAGRQQVGGADRHVVIQIRAQAEVAGEDFDAGIGVIHFDVGAEVTHETYLGHGIHQMGGEVADAHGFCGGERRRQQTGGGVFCAAHHYLAGWNLGSLDDHVRFHWLIPLGYWHYLKGRPARDG